jgi:vacuolar-type H+-ATPase subunit I/STV1
MADMKNPVQELAEVKTERDELKATVSALELRIKAMEEEKEKEEAEETEEEKKKREEEEESSRKAKAEEDKEKEEKDEETKALAAKVTALESFIKSPEFRASLVAGSSDGVPEGGASGGKTLTMAEAVAEYNKIDPNDAKARAAYREAHKSELGL